MPSSSSRPPGTPWYGVNFTWTGKPAGTFFLIASMHSSVKRMRFSSEPPYSSVRSFHIVDWNWSSR